MTLRDITRQAVLAAAAEYDELGQDAFLEKYGFDRARSYRLIHDGKSYDSKAIVGAAHGYLPGERPLAAREFSGGEATVGRLLRGLGFAVRIGAELTSDDLVDLIDKLHVRWVSGQPALYQPITLLWAIGRARRGEPRLLDWQTTRLQVGELLERYGFLGERVRPDYPVAALCNAGIWELHRDAGPVPAAQGDAELERWFDRHAPVNGFTAAVYELFRVSSPVRVAAVRAILEKFFQGSNYLALLEDVGLTDTGIAAEIGDPDDQWIVRSPLEDAYRRLCGLAYRDRQRNDGKRVSRTSEKLIRSEAARRAVLLRCAGICENPDCLGHPYVLTDAGDPILEIDHIHDLAKGGTDDPRQMIALCPNCHAVKTRGRNREDLRQRLFAVARRRHDELVRQS
jgi:5-methylcytosine-specific restriction enzyme A